MVTPVERPHLAIIGGGGAMGRLFARLLTPAVSELYVFDFFDAASHPAPLGKLLDDVRFSADSAGLVGAPIPVLRHADGTVWTTSSELGDLRRGRACLPLLPREGVLRPDGANDQKGEAPFAAAASLVDLLRSGGPLNDGRSSQSTLVYAGLPEDAHELLPRADIVLLAVGYESDLAYRAIVRSYCPAFRPGSLIVDLGSTKLPSLVALESELPSEVGVLGAHPLFGPTVSDLTGLIVAVVDAADGRPLSPWREWFVEQLARLKMIVTPATAREHDDAMAFVQALTHFTLLSYAYTFVRLDFDPVELLAFRTPVFEPLLYLAARVANLARSTPETYRSIQALSTRPDARRAFLDTARELLETIERAHDQPTDAGVDRTDPLVALFQKYGTPWSPDGRDRGARQRREHLLEMGARLVDDLNQLRQEIVVAAGQVRAIEEKRMGQPPRIVIGIVDLDLLAPGRQDVASRVRLRQLNLLLGSIRGGGANDSGQHDLIIPLARARVLGVDETLDWLLTQPELVEVRSYPARVPDWFDREILLRLLKGFSDRPETTQSRVWDVNLTPAHSNAKGGRAEGEKAVVISLSIVLHPADLVAIRREIESAGAKAFARELSELDARLTEIHGHLEAGIARGAKYDALSREKDRLKHQRKAVIDQRTAWVDRRVRQETRLRVQSIFEQAVSWLNAHGCSSLVRGQST